MAATSGPSAALSYCEYSTRVRAGSASIKRPIRACARPAYPCARVGGEPDEDPRADRCESARGGAAEPIPRRTRETYEYFARAPHLRVHTAAHGFAGHVPPAYESRSGEILNRDKPRIRTGIPRMAAFTLNAKSRVRTVFDIVSSVVYFGRRSLLCVQFEKVFR